MILLKQIRKLLGDCPYCGDRRGFWDCEAMCRYRYEPPDSCERCGTRSWEMRDGWYCMRCNPDGPWVPGFGPDGDDPKHRPPHLALLVKCIASRALRPVVHTPEGGWQSWPASIHPDDIDLEGGRQ